MDGSSIEIRPLATHDELAACIDLQQEIWGEGFSDQVPSSILKVTQRIGGVAAGAFDAEGTLVGFVFGLTGIERGRIVHWSDMLGVRHSARNLGLGRRLKMYQRDVVRELGAELIYWTFDPLIARNAHLNFNRLGAHVAEYVEDMYGVTGSSLHGGLPTDRLVVAWPTRDDDVNARLIESRQVTESPDCLSAPVVSPDLIESVAGASILPHCVRVELPLAAERLMVASPEDALRWRLDVRRGLRWGMSAGYNVRGFASDESSERGYYLMTRSGRGTTRLPGDGGNVL